MDKEVTPELVDIHTQCERALRRMRALARERNDILLAQAIRSVKRAAELSDSPVQSVGLDRAA